MLWSLTAAALAVLSFGLTLWQWWVAKRFPLHRRTADNSFCPGVTLLKPLKGCDPHTESCLRSWFDQEYAGPAQILFGVASPDDPVCSLARRLLAEHPQADAELVFCREALGPNAKVSTLAQLQPRARHEVIVVSDADVLAPPDLLANLVAPLQQREIGLVNCFYRLAHPATPAMRWEAVAVNADFWSQVLQAQSLTPPDFALGAVMATTQSQLNGIGSFSSLLEYLADDYQLGHKIARRGGRIALCPVVVECRSEPMGWRRVWTHQLRWARTIRVCQPLPFFFSILSNGTLWPIVWAALDRTGATAGLASLFVLTRLLTCQSNQRQLTGEPSRWADAGYVLAKDLLGIAVWALAFAGNRIEWRGHRYRMLSDGRLLPIASR